MRASNLTLLLLLLQLLWSHVLWLLLLLVPLLLDGNKRQWPAVLTRQDASACRCCKRRVSLSSTSCRRRCGIIRPLSTQLRVRLVHRHALLLLLECWICLSLLLLQHLAILYRLLALLQQQRLARKRLAVRVPPPLLLQLPWVKHHEALWWPDLTAGNGCGNGWQRPEPRHDGRGGRLPRLGLATRCQHPGLCADHLFCSAGAERGAEEKMAGVLNKGVLGVRVKKGSKWKDVRAISSLCHRLQISGSPRRWLRQRAPHHNNYGYTSTTSKPPSEPRSDAATTYVAHVHVCDVA